MSIWLTPNFAGLAGIAQATPTSRGYLITPEELQAIGFKAEQGIEPHATNVQLFLNDETLGEPQRWIGSRTIPAAPQCSDGTQTDSTGKRIRRGPVYLTEGSHLTYAKTLAAHLLKGSRSEAYAADARLRILELTRATNWGGEDYSGGNQCILYLSWYVPNFVMAADLLEPFPSIWTADDKQQFSDWLVEYAYPKVAWASRARSGNWGASGSYASAVIADYLKGSEYVLPEDAPVERELSPVQAYEEHTAEQLSRMSTVVAPRDRDDARCLPYKGIQPSGAIPEELRRAKIADPLSLCSATFLPSIRNDYAPAYTYHIIHIEVLVAHAELALRRGDSSLYDHRAADNSGSILQAMKFITQNPVNPQASYPWNRHRKALMYVAYRYYRDPAIAAQLQNASVRSGELITYGALTHAFSPTEDPGLPPVPADQAPATSRSANPLDYFETQGGTWSYQYNILAVDEPVRGTIGYGHGNMAIYRQPVQGDLVISTSARVRESGTQYNDVVLVFSYRDAQNYSFVSINETNDAYTSGIFTLRNGVQTELFDITTPIEAERWYTIRLKKQDQTVTVFLDDVMVGSAGSPAFGDGKVGVATFNDAAEFTGLQLQSPEVLIEEDFSRDASPFQPLGGDWRVADGAYTLTNPLPIQSGEPFRNIALFPNTLNDDFVLNLEARTNGTESPYNDLAMMIAYRDPLNYAFVSLNETNDTKTSGVFRVANGVQTELVDISAAISSDTWYTVTIERYGDNLMVTFDGNTVAEVRDGSFIGGRFGLASLNDSVSFDNVTLKSLPSPQFLLER